MGNFLLYLAIFFVPMGAKVLSFPIMGVKMSMFRLLVIISVLMLLVETMHKEKKLLRIWYAGNRYSVRFMLFWLVYATVSIFWAKDYSNWFRNLFFLLVAVLCIILFINRFSGKEHIIKAFWALNLGIALQSVIGWYETFTLDYRFIDWTDKLQELYSHGKLRGPIAMAGNQNDFATMMLVGVFIAYGCFSLTKKRLLKAFFGVLMLSETALIFISTSRACMLGFLLAVLLILLVGGKKKLLIIPTAGILLLLFPGILDNVSYHMYLNLSRAGSGDSSRLNLMRNGIVFFLDTLGFGVGCGQIESWMLTEAVYPTFGIINMHNWWLEVLVGYGLWVFIGYIVFYVKILLDNIRFWVHATDAVNRQISLSFSVVLFGYTIASISSSSNMTNEFLWVFWALCITHQGLLFHSNDNTQERLDGIAVQEC